MSGAQLRAKFVKKKGGKPNLKKIIIKSNDLLKDSSKNHRDESTEDDNVYDNVYDNVDDNVDDSTETKLKPIGPNKKSCFKIRRRENTKETPIPNHRKKIGMLFKKKILIKNESIKNNAPIAADMLDSKVKNILTKQQPSKNVKKMIVEEDVVVEEEKPRPKFPPQKVKNNFIKQPPPRSVKKTIVEEEEDPRLKIPPPPQKVINHFTKQPPKTKSVEEEVVEKEHRRSKIPPPQKVKNHFTKQQKTIVEEEVNEEEEEPRLKIQPPQKVKKQFTKQPPLKTKSVKKEVEVDEEEPSPPEANKVDIMAAVKNMAGNVLGVDPGDTSKLIHALMQRLRPQVQAVQPQQSQPSVAPIPIKETYRQQEISQPFPIPFKIFTDVTEDRDRERYMERERYREKELEKEKYIEKERYGAHNSDAIVIRPRTRIGRDIITKSLLEQDTRELKQKLHEHVVSMRVSALSNVVGGRSRANRK